MRRVVLAVLAALLASVPAVPGAQTAKERAARALFTEGVAAYDAARFDEATDLLDQAMRNADRPSIRVMLASSLAKRGKCDRVADLLGGVDWKKVPAGERAEYERKAAEVRQRCPALVTATPVVVPPTAPFLNPVAATAAVPAGMVRIPAGEFLMGSPSSEKGHHDGERQHRVKLTKPFLLKTTEVTQGEWQSLMGNNPASAPGCGADCPVENVSWWDAVTYCNALSRKEGLPACYKLSGCTGTPKDPKYECAGVSYLGPACTGYRLPTEAEWEYAARAGTASPYYSGNSPDDAAWHAANSGRVTHKVRGKKPNAWGLYDMLGNVNEWVWDVHHEYPSSEVTDPTGPATGSLRSNRGGAWIYEGTNLRAAARFSLGPTTRVSFIGFRVARTP